MNKRILLLLALAAVSGPHLRAEDLNLNERPDTQTVSLSPYSLGVGGGAIAAVNDELMAVSEQFLKLSIIQSIIFQDRWSLNLDADWLLPGKNMGLDLSADYLLATGAFKPFLGVGGGVRYFDRPTLGQGLGPSVTAHAGLLLDVLDEMQLRVRVPFHYVLNEDRDMGVGLDVGVLFSSPLRTTRVKKLRY
jgi:hypothetical protein